MAEIQFTYKDVKGETATATIPTRNVDAANFDAINTELGNLETAIGDITLGNLNRRRLVAVADDVSNGNASNGAAVRELKLLVTVEDTISKKQYRMEIPAPDVNKAIWLTSNKERLLDLTSTEGAAFVTALEASYESPDGNSNSVDGAGTIVLKEARIVGRNL